MDNPAEDLPAARLVKESKAEKRQRKKVERLSDTRPLESWERYRALSDLIDHMMDIVELADRRTRFALLILGALNAVNLLIAVRADALGVQGISLAFIRVHITCYVLLSLYFFVFAIVALKPRLRQPGANPSVDSARSGLRLVDDIVHQSADESYARWQLADIGGLNKEMAHHAHILSRTNAAKYHALERVYLGLVILVALTALLIAVLGIHLIATPT